MRRDDIMVNIGVMPNGFCSSRVFYEPQLNKKYSIEIHHGQGNAYGQRHIRFYGVTISFDSDVCLDFNVVESDKNADTIAVIDRLIEDSKSESPRRHKSRSNMIKKLFSHLGSKDIVDLVTLSIERGKKSGKAKLQHNIAVLLNV